MTRWTSKVAIKHLLEHDDESHEAIQRSMIAIANALENAPAFAYFDRDWIEIMRNIPQGDGFFSPTDYANRLLDRMYDFADSHGIWIG